VEENLEQPLSQQLQTQQQADDKIPHSINKSRLILLIIFILLIVGCGLFFWQKSLTKNNTHQNQRDVQVYSSKEECERKTECNECNFEQCDYVPSNKTYEEVCGNFQKGWGCTERKTANLTPTSDSTVNWKIYTNTKDGYSIKYPSSLFIITNDPDYPWAVLISNTQNNVENSGICRDACIRFFLSFSNKKIPDSIYYVPQGSDVNPTQKVFSVNGYSGIRATSYPSSGSTDVVFLRNPKGGYIDLEMNYPEAKTAEDKNIFDQMLSTFKFTDQNITPVSSNGIISGKYCYFDFHNYLDKENIAKAYFDFCEENIPQIAGKLGVEMDGRRVNLKYDGSISAYAQVDGDSIVFKNWVKDTGFLLHEGVHFVQNYENKASGREWVTEGLADMVRFELTKVSDEPGWAIGCRTGEGYTFGYGCAAAFFIWTGNYCGKNDIQIPLNKMILDGTDTNVTFNNLCGKNIDELWGIYKATNPLERIYPQT
jgi:hypothetical protein